MDGISLLPLSASHPVTSAPNLRCIIASLLCIFIQLFLKLIHGVTLPPSSAYSFSYFWSESMASHCFPPLHIYPAISEANPWCHIAFLLCIFIQLFLKLIHDVTLLRSPYPEASAWNSNASLLWISIPLFPSFPMSVTKHNECPSTTPWLYLNLCKCALRDFRHLTLSTDYADKRLSRGGLHEFSVNTDENSFSLKQEE